MPTEKLTDPKIWQAKPVDKPYKVFRRRRLVSAGSAGRPSAASRRAALTGLAAHGLFSRQGRERLPKLRKTHLHKKSYFLYKCCRDTPITRQERFLIKLIVVRINHPQAQGVSPDSQVQDCAHGHHSFDDDSAVFLAGNQRLVAAHAAPDQRRGYRARLHGLYVETLGRDHLHHEVAPVIAGLKGLAQKHDDAHGMDN